MHMRALGSVQVTAIGLGGMPMSISGRPSEEQSIRTIHASLDAGVTFVDTADCYCLDHSDIGHNERLFAKALQGRTGVTVATKAGLQRPNGAWTRNGQPAHLRKALEQSLRSLGVPAIDLWQHHAPDEKVPLEDSLAVFAEAKNAGKVKQVGVSNYSVDQLDRAVKVVPIVSVQNRCNVYDRRAFSDGVLAWCERNRVAFLPWSPVGGGRDKGRLAKDPVLTGIARAHEVSAYQVALAWLLAKSPAMIAIPGASKPENALDSARAADLVLSTDELARIDAIHV